MVLSCAGCKSGLQMYTVRCTICRQTLPKIRDLFNHYYRRHSKLKIIKQLILQSIPKWISHCNKPKNISPIKSTNKTPSKNKKIKSETLFLNDSIHILCSKTDIIIGDGNNSINLGFPNNKPERLNENVSKKPTGDKCTSKKRKILESRKSSTSTTSSEEPYKKTVKRKASNFKPKRNLEYYRINISKLSEHKSLSETTGEFYICHCRKKNSKASNMFQRSHLKIFTSDTESASSDFGKNSFFCTKCGNGYRNTIALLEHMKVHERHCRVCDEIFPNEQSFKAHVQEHIFKVYACHYRSCQFEFPFKEMLHRHLDTHVENEILNSVLDMEEEYNVEGYNRFESNNYQESINNILGFLTETPSYISQTVVCDMCAQEMLLCDYEMHLRNIHYIYSVQNGH